MDSIVEETVADLVYRSRNTGPFMEQTTDIILSGGIIVDGTEVPGFRGDVAIHNGRIAAVTRPEAGTSATPDSW